MDMSESTTERLLEHDRQKGDRHLSFPLPFLFHFPPYDRNDNSTAPSEILPEQPKDSNLLESILIR